MTLSRYFLLLLPLLLFSSASDGQTISVTDIGLQTGFQDTTLGHFKRGRACVAADFDLDGYVDFYIGNPGDESYILHNVPSGGNDRRFEFLPLPLDGELTWGAVAFDYDNDGDYDLFVSVGGSEGIGFDFLFRNEWIEGGILQFTDVSGVAGIQGIIPDGETDPVQSSSANAVTADYDVDGDTDLFVNGNIKPIPKHPELVGRNTLWRNNGDGTFTDVTMEAGLGEYRHATRHSTFFDFDNDGDSDLYENNFFGCNVLWRNNGDGTFADVTVAMSLPGEDLSDPTSSFASAAGDFNNDGWEDLIVFMRGDGRDGDATTAICDCSGCDNEIPIDNVKCDGLDAYPAGHVLFMNNGGTGFANVAELVGINDQYIGENGVMGCQIGDLNGDGTPDVYVGNGGPPSGEADRLYISTNELGAAIPSYTNETTTIDFPAETGGGEFPPYPYRTHGIAFVDVDNSGTIEIAVTNGGPVESPDSVREPDRLFAIRTVEAFNYLKVRPVGNGTAVSKDAVGTRMIVRATDPFGEEKVVYKTLFAGSAFSAQNGFEVFIGLGNANMIQSLDILWPNGVTSVLTQGLTINSRIVVSYDEVVTGMAGETQLPGSFDVEQNYPNPFNPSTVIEYSLGTADHVTLKVYSMVGEEVITLVDENQDAGRKVVSWDGRDSKGTQMASGMYVYRISTSSSVEVRKMVLMK